MKTTRRIVQLLCTGCAAVSVHADVVTIGAAKDASIFQNNVNNSNGGGPGIFVGTSGAGSPRRSLIQFDIAAAIPAGATITEVQLTLTLGQTSSVTTATIGLFRAMQDWGEGTTGSTAAGISGTGQGFAANAGDATWNAAFFPGTAWATPGGDYATVASASLFLPNNTVNSSFTWLSTPQLVADVQGWLANPAVNFGWELINANESAANTAFVFYSSEWDTFAGGSVSQEPALRIAYAVPEPAGAALLASGALAWLAARRRRDAPTA